MTKRKRGSKKRKQRPSDQTLRAREVEDLVARLEQLLHGTTANIQIRERMQGRTGRKREVDVAVRVHAGSVELLVIFECRGRRRVEDVIWIEQLATKRVTLGAHAIIGVSSSGFSADAFATARLHGVELRTIEAIALADFQGLLPFSVRAEFSRMELEIVRCRAHFPPEVRDLPSYKALTYDDRVFSHADEQERFSITELLERTKETFVDGLPRLDNRDLDRMAPGPSPEEREYTYGASLDLHLDGKVWRVDGLSLTVNVKTTVIPMPAESAQSYKTAGAVAPHVARAKLNVDDVPGVAAAHISVVPSQKTITFEYQVASLGSKR